MKRLIFIAILLLPTLSQGKVKINYTGDELPAKITVQIDKMMDYMWGYYSIFGLNEELEVELKVFDKKKDGYRYMRSIYPDRPEYIEQPHDKIMGGGLAGVYIPAENMAVILGMENGPEKAISLIYHELSHHFTNKLFTKRSLVPTWLNEGLASHFGSLVVGRKNNIVSEFPHADKGKVKTMLMLGDLNLSKFLDMKHHEFMEIQRYEGQTNYSLAHVTISVIMQNLDKKQMSCLMGAIVNRKREDKVSDIIEEFYPGGIQGLGSDILEFVSK